MENQVLGSRLGSPASPVCYLTEPLVSPHWSQTRVPGLQVYTTMPFLLRSFARLSGSSVYVYTVMAGASWSGRRHDSGVVLDPEPAHFLGALSERGAWQL